ncbi:DUF6588 family protein [Aquimarina algicola]|uniref:Uncharacterized protein n=1 Tax=Aquimarina algicola TaxID=2589995 RepID=A0A504ITB4_9FLAO|nr:DUF6588 family protein [Aquimarina algicola]TPN81717.1 hypothetical protein FHK87_24265 [Aquimarina algicola]
MKKYTLLLALLLTRVGFSQTDINQILEIGLDNAQKFSEDYFDAAGESLINAVSNGWYNSAKVKELFHFEVGIVGNLSFIREEKKSFVLDTREYNNLAFRNGTVRQTVGNVFGANQQDVAVVITDGVGAGLEVVLPGGISDSEMGVVPSGFLQASMGLIKSTEIKLRFLPKVKAIEDAEVQLYGIGFQHEFTDWVFPLKRWPVRLSGLVGYTNVKGSYDIDENSQIPGEDQKVELNSNAFFITSIVSTRLPVLNFYGGIGYYFGNNDAEVLGTYQVQNGPLSSQTLTDPISVKNKTNGVKATIGAKAQFGVFRANLDYSLQNFQNLSLGVHFGW